MMVIEEFMNMEQLLRRDNMIPSLPTSALKPIPGLIGPKDLTVEEWREYDFLDHEGHQRIYRITSPVSLYYRMPGGTTHRVVDSEGIVHCVPAPGVSCCVLRWKNVGVAEGADPITY